LFHFSLKIYFISKTVRYLWSTLYNRNRKFSYRYTEFSCRSCGIITWVVTNIYRT